MIIWHISFDPDTFQPLARVHDQPAHVQHDWFVGEPLRAVWTEIAVAFIEDGRVRGDFPSFGGIPPVFNGRALRILTPLIANDVEVLPLRCDAEPLLAINVLRIVDCLDHTSSHVERFSNGRIMRIERYSFHETRIGNAHMFKIPEQVRNHVYVSNTFKQTVEAHHLRGMVFTKVYDGRAAW